jgi:arsenate reductase
LLRRRGLRAGLPAGENPGAWRTQEIRMTGYNVLFLCTGNSARSIFGEALLNHWGKGRFRAFSAGSFPKGIAHPLAIELLQSLLLPVEGVRSKSWNEFAAPDAPTMDFVITVCDQAASEVCPIWPGQPITAHWGVPDPAAATGSIDAQRAAFRDAFRRLDARIKLFVALPFDKLDRMMLTRETERIGRIGAGPSDKAAS